MSSTHNIGLLNPGNMGSCVAATLKNSGHNVCWAAEHRSQATRFRAEQLGLTEIQSLAELCRTVEVVVSVCPPHAAEEQADQVMSNGFTGIYVEANAISPQRCEQIAERVTTAGAGFVDGGIIGLPTENPGETWMHLSGDRAADIAGLFADGPMETNIVGPRPGQASALKMCYAAYRKGTTALIAAVLGAAEAMQVREHLERQWQDHWPGFVDESHTRITGVTAKAWRFIGEMQEISATLEHAGLPGGFHQAAEDVYARMAGFKDAVEKPSLDDVLRALIDPENKQHD